MPKFKNMENLVAVDIGCNSGNFIKKYHTNFNKIHFYEINEKLYNYVKNKYGNDNIIGFNEAVSKESGKELEIMIHRSLDAGSTAINNDNIIIQEWTDKVKKIKSINLETVIQRAGGYIDYLKMDCETSEYDILMNKDLSKIGFLAIEIHWQLGKENWDNLIKYLLQYFKMYSGPGIDWPQKRNKEFHFISRTYNNI